MKIGIKEAFETAQKALPGCKVEVEASIGNIYSFKGEGVFWTITAKSENGSYSESDNLFSVALGKVMAELSRSKATSAEDVVVSDEAEAKQPPTPTPVATSAPTSEAPLY